MGQVPMLHAVPRPVHLPSSQPTQPSLLVSMQQPYPEPGLQRSQRQQRLVSERGPAQMPVQQQPTFVLSSQHEQMPSRPQMPMQQQQTAVQPHMPTPQQPMLMQRQPQTGSP